MKWIQLRSITLRNFGPFDGEHLLELPLVGMVLVKGAVAETGDGSGAGKSYLLKAISYLFGGCPDPATEIQSWFTDSPPEAEAEIETPKGTITIRRKKGLAISGEMYPETIRGNAAETELDNIFGMDERSRAIVTYRGQRQPGMFLSLNDDKKKSFLANLLGLDAYENVVKDCQSRLPGLTQALEATQGSLQATQRHLQSANEGLVNARLDLERFVKVNRVQQSLVTLAAQISNTKEAIGKVRAEISSTKNIATQTQQAIVGKYQAKIKTAFEQGDCGVELAALSTKKDAIHAELTEITNQWMFDTSKITGQRQKLDSEINRLRREIETQVRLQDELNSLQARMEVLEAQKCSECQRVWIGADQQTKLDSVRQEIESKKFAIDKLGDMAQLLVTTKAQKDALVEPPKPARMEELTVAEYELKTQVKKVQEQAAAKRDLAVQALEHQRQEEVELLKKETLDKLTPLTKEEGLLESALGSLQSEERDILASQGQLEAKRAVVSELERQVKAQEVQLKGEQDKVVAADQKVCFEKDMVALIGREGFLGSIVEEVLIEIASVANDILSQVANVRHLSIEFETEKQSAAGNVAARITPIVYSRGRKVSFKSGISGGMQAAVELAVDLAVGDVVSRRRGSFPSWLILDEALHGLGGIAKESCLEMLQNYASNRVVFVVDHDSSFAGLFNSAITVEMIDGHSKVMV